WSLRSSWVSARRAGCDALILDQEPGEIFLVIPGDDASRGHDQGAPDQIRILRHQADRLVAGGRALLHVQAPVELVARVQEVARVGPGKKPLELAHPERLPDEIALDEPGPLLEQKTFCSAAGDSGRLVVERHLSAAHPVASTSQAGSIAPESRSGRTAEV